MGSIQRHRISCKMSLAAAISLAVVGFLGVKSLRSSQVKTKPLKAYHETAASLAVEAPHQAVRSISSAFVALGTLSESKESRSKRILSPKMNLSLSALLKANPALQELNPGIDFKSLTADDPRIKDIKLPKNARMALVKDPLCARSSVSSLGESSEDLASEAADVSRAPSVIGFSTDEEQTLGQLDEVISANNCVLSVLNNGTINSVKLPQDTTHLADFLPAGTQGVPSLYDYNQLIEAGRSIVMKSIAEGDPQKAQVYVVGMGADGGEKTNPTLPVPVVGVPVPGNAANIYLFPSTPNNSGNEIAELNNQIILSVTQGAHFVLVPLVDPNSILPGIQYAAVQGVKVVMIPPNAQFVPQDPSSQNAGNT